MQNPNATKLNVGARTQSRLDALLDSSEAGMFLGRWSRAVIDCGRTTREICGIYDSDLEFLGRVLKPRGTALTLFLLEVVSAL